MTATTAAAIEVRGAGKSFAGRPCLRDVDLHVGRGELIGLVGPNGAGKSTLLRCLVGLLQRDGGAMSVAGHDPRTDSLAIRQQCSYLPGETSIYLGMTGTEFLDFALAFHRARNQRLIDRLLAGFGLPLRRKVRTYSAGMKQKLALCAALGPDLPLYLLDEPDRALDATVRMFLRDVLHELHVEGRTILLSSHHLAEVESLANRVVFLVDGAIVPHQQVAAARAQLHNRVRLRLSRPVELPDGAERLPDDPDGTMVLQCDGEAAAWLARVPAAAIDTAEIGAVRLEDLYRLLTGIDQPGGRA